MDLSDLTPQARADLAAKVGCNPKYLYQCASGRRRASPDLARALVAADPRLTLEGVLFPGQAEPAPSVLPPPEADPSPIPRPASGPAPMADSEH
jgi:hypothetical protein